MIEHEASPVYSKTYQASLVELNLVEAGIGGKGWQGTTWDLVSVLLLGSNMKGHFILLCKDSKCWTQATYTSGACFSVSFASFVWGYRFGWCLHFRFHLVPTMFLQKLPPKIRMICQLPKTCWDVGSSSMGYIWLPFTQVIRDSPGCQPPHSPGTREQPKAGGTLESSNVVAPKRRILFPFWIYHEIDRNGMILLPRRGVLDVFSLWENG